jgi:hypothetical protein
MPKLFTKYPGFATAHIPVLSLAVWQSAGFGLHVLSVSRHSLEAQGANSQICNVGFT